MPTLLGWCDDGGNIDIIGIMPLLLLLLPVALAGSIFIFLIFFIFFVVFVGIIILNVMLGQRR